MPKQIIFILVILCSLSVLSCCGRAEVTPEETLDDLYSISDAFLNVHYSVTINQAEEYEQLYTEIINIVSSQTPPTTPGLYSLLEERYEALLKQKYQTQPMADKGFELIVRNGMITTLWKEVLKAGSDIEVTSVKTLLKNTDIDDEENFINYTVGLLIDKTSYEVTGELALVLVDNKWMINGIQEFGWSPSFLY